MKAKQIAQHLLEADEPIDAKRFIAGIDQTTAEQLKAALFDTDWLHYLPTRVFISGGHPEISVQIRFIDNPFRSRFAAMGARVTGTPDHPPQAAWLHNVFKGAARRAGLKFKNYFVEQVQPAHHGIDLERLPEDFEDDQGDWIVDYTVELA